MRLIVGISGASGIAYGIRLLEALRETPAETHLVMTNAAKLTLAHECDASVGEVEALADEHHPNSRIDAAIASGSFQTAGMIVAPCSIRSLSAIATGVTDTLLTRAADVVLKERRRLVLMVRETPLHSGHLRSMLAVSEMGAVVAPAMPAFYPMPASLDEMVDYTIQRTLDLFGIEALQVHRWSDRKPQRIKLAEV